MPKFDFSQANKKYSIEGTLFQIKVWQELLRIPKGKTITYAELAKRIGRPRAARAVANACGANKLPGIIPCHRVVAQHGLGGYSAPGGIRRKWQLLKSEKIKCTYTHFVV